jgi:hypothetical protein
MEQTIALQGHNLKWDLLTNTSKLCHYCGKLGYNPRSCPLKEGRGRLCTRDLVAKLKDRFKLNNPNNQRANSNKSRSRSHSKFCDQSHFEPSRSGPDTANADHHNQNPSNNHNKQPHNSSNTRPRSNDRNNKECSVSFSAADHNTVSHPNNNKHQPILKPSD